MAGVYVKGMKLPKDGTYRMGLVAKEGRVTAGLVKEESFADKDIEWFDCVSVPDLKSGKWSDISGQACLCSVCGRPQNYKQAMGWKYCPCCGAKMQEVEKDE